MSRQFDVIIFGATGYTGKYAIREGIKILKGLKWAIAGRSKSKLESALRDIGKKMNVDLSKIPIIIADVKDQSSLNEMTSKGKVIVNCCGPYYLYGEPVIKACIENSTSHVDITGESLFMEEMQLKYNDAAREKGIYIISACGIDSIPAEMGVSFMQNNFNGTINSVETYVGGSLDDGYNPTGAMINIGTFHSVVIMLANLSKAEKVRQQLFPSALPLFKPVLKSRLIHRRTVLGKNHWCFPLMEPDQSVVARSQRYLFENENQRPIQLKSYLMLDKLYHAVGLAMLSTVWFVLSQFSCGRYLLVNYAEILTFGIFSSKGNELKEGTGEKVNFDFVLIGQGWKEQTADASDNINIPMNKEMVVKISGKNPGYGATSAALLLSATTILKESEKIPENGGVLTPCVAFRNTSYIQELQKNGFKFEVIEV